MRRGETASQKPSYEFFNRTGNNPNIAVGTKNHNWGGLNIAPFVVPISEY